MPDLSSNPNQPRKRKELTMEVRLIIAFVLMGIVLFISPLIFGPPPAPPRPTKPPTEAQAPNPEEPKKPDVQKPDAPLQSAAPAGDFIGPRDTPKTLTVETKLYTVKLTNIGGVVTSWVLKNSPVFKNTEGNLLELVNPALLASISKATEKDTTVTITTAAPHGFAAGQTVRILGVGVPDYNGQFAIVATPSITTFTYTAAKPGLATSSGGTVLDAKKPAPFSIMNQDGKEAELNNAVFSTSRTEDNDGTTVGFSFADGVTQCTKTFRFNKNSYLSTVVTEVKQNGKSLPHLLEWRGGFGDFKVLNRQMVEQSVYFDLNNNKLLIHAASSPADEHGLYSFAGLQDTYFAALLLPESKEPIEVKTLNDPLKPNKDAEAEPFVGVAVGDGDKNEFTVFVGPKNVDILNSVDSRLTQLIDWGWFWFFAKPLFYSLHWLNDHVLHSYGWSIVVVTIFINILLLPLRFKSMKSAKKMQALQPQIKAINAKYKDVGMRDPRKAEQNQEIMELYKKNGVNPMGGCLPMLIQLPILYAFYKVLNVTVELRGASWLWVADLSQPESLPIHILPIVMIITQFMMQKMTPAPGADASQAKMMRFMPLIFGFFFYNMSSGLVLYWLTGNLVGIVQQSLMNKRTPAPYVPPQPTAGPAKKKRG
jgi:YidC/Oxa1 family membrane protein insertase